MTVIDGKRFAAELRRRIGIQVETLQSNYGVEPGLATILVGADPASQVYVSNKNRQSKECGMRSFQFNFDTSISETELVTKIIELNSDPLIHGILVQLPLPAHINAEIVINAIDPDKDVDGFHTRNVGRLGTGQKALIPCTPLGCLLLLKEHFGDLKGRSALVIGRSNIVGKPMAQLLLAEDCTVTIAHRHTKDLPSLCRGAEILVAAVGKAEMVKTDWISPGTVVIDVGINRIERMGKTVLVGDVDFGEVQHVAGAITPVPGGVGPMTIACLLMNTLNAFCRLHGFQEFSPASKGMLPELLP